MGKNLVTAQIRGESRALCLGAVMVVCSAITYYILGTTVVPLHHKSVWSKISKCQLIEADIRDHERLDGKKVPQYPCLWVNVSAIGKSVILYHTEETIEKNNQPLGVLLSYFEKSYTWKSQEPGPCCCGCPLSLKKTMTSMSPSTTFCETGMIKFGKTS
ncbi:calcium-activated potassium channel subunit beta-1 isoform X3 [Macrotis lagotis]|uniref:calcium-activated potassium channel subunit beta-1 isoform X3 n=1 Tax=Macrotis lagotis TaxID=92651 RepID=UPI003D690FF9